MNADVYDPQRVRNLVPLLRAITAEMRERTSSIDQLEAHVEGLYEPSDRRSREQHAQDLAALAVHRRELRLATRELVRLGCVLDADHPLRVLIPGADGELAHGWSWTPADENLQPAG